MLTQEQRTKVISNTLRQSYYIGMNLIRHKIEKVIRAPGEGMVIYRGVLTLKHTPTNHLIRLTIRSDKYINGKQKDRVFGYVDKVEIKSEKDKIYEDSSGLEVRRLIERFEQGGK